VLRYDPRHKKDGLVVARAAFLACQLLARRQSRLVGRQTGRARSFERLLRACGKRCGADAIGGVHQGPNAPGRQIPPGFLHITLAPTIEIWASRKAAEHRRQDRGRLMDGHRPRGRSLIPPSWGGERSGKTRIAAPIVFITSWLPRELTGRSQRTSQYDENFQGVSQRWGLYGSRTMRFAMPATE